MKEYIERKELLAECDEAIANIQFSSPYQNDISVMISGMERIRDLIYDALTADVVEVKHGTWNIEPNEEMPDPMFKLAVCSVCNEKAGHTHRYCPYCGAKMTEEV